VLRKRPFTILNLTHPARIIAYTLMAPMVVSEKYGTDSNIIIFIAVLYLILSPHIYYLIGKKFFSSGKVENLFDIGYILLYVDCISLGGLVTYLQFSVLPFICYSVMLTMNALVMGGFRLLFICGGVYALSVAGSGYLIGFAFSNEFKLSSTVIGTATLLIYCGIIALNSHNLVMRLGKLNARLELLTNKLKKYLSPQVYNSIFKGDNTVRLGTEKKYLTVFFSDIVGFTNTSESMDQEELATWLNDYLNEMAEIALRYGGTLDKFIGDAVMIFFGDPESYGEDLDAIKCVLMAMEMRERAKLMNVHIRIGINSGPCVVGNFGSEDRMEYTVVGKTVNMAARLESNSESEKILICDTTYELVKEVIRCEERGEIRVKGIDRDIMTYWAVEYQRKFDEQLKTTS